MKCQTSSRYYNKHSRDSYITDSVEKWYHGTLHRTDIFTVWQVIIPSGVTTKAYAISYQRTFSDFERVMSSSYRAG
jgi:hypothetical protein